MSSATVLLTLRGPLQSWSVSATGGAVRDTERYPTKSGVLGIVAAAMGRDRGSDLSDLAGLDFGVRVDHLGVLHRDYHTYLPHEPKDPTSTQPVRYAPAANHQIGSRYYRADAAYIAGLSGPSETVEEIVAALLNPVYGAFLGRRNAVPSRPVLVPNDKVFAGGLDAAMADRPWAAPDHIIRALHRQVQWEQAEREWQEAREASEKARLEVREALEAALLADGEPVPDSTDSPAPGMGVEKDSEKYRRFEVVDGRVVLPYLRDARPGEDADGRVFDQPFHGRYAARRVRWTTVAVAIPEEGSVRRRRPVRDPIPTGPDGLFPELVRVPVPSAAVPASGCTDVHDPFALFE